MNLRQRTEAIKMRLKNDQNNRLKNGRLYKLIIVFMKWTRDVNSSKVWILSSDHTYFLFFLPRLVGYACFLHCCLQNESVPTFLCLVFTPGQPEEHSKHFLFDRPVDSVVCFCCHGRTRYYRLWKMIIANHFPFPAVYGCFVRVLLQCVMVWINNTFWMKLKGFRVINVLQWVFDCHTSEEK